MIDALAWHLVVRPVVHVAENFGAWLYGLCIVPGYVLAWSVL